ncbi:MAG: MFS transporter, partial [Parvularcula sp.]|nr:MFS transporter [Parvularcula sp.]
MSRSAPAPADEDRIPILGLAAAIAAITVSGAGFGHSIPLFSVLLERYGASDFVIGANTAFAAVAGVIGAPFYPSVITRIGLKPFMLASLAMMILPYLALFAVGDFVAAWFPLRFIISLGVGALFAGSEIWINGLAPDRIRGKVIGIYGTCLALGFALGPLLLGV